MALTTDRQDPRLRETVADGPRAGQQSAYLVLSDEERARGFVRPVRCTYVHTKCGTHTTMGGAIAETYARKPTFYGATFCAGSSCRAHFPVAEFRWVEDGRETDLVLGS
jgi:hypothetical protein